LDAAAGGVPPPAAKDATVSARLEPLPAAVAARIGPARFTLWFQGHTRFLSLGGEVIVVARNESCRDWLEQTFGDAVGSAASEFHGSPTPVKWVVDPGAFSEPLPPEPAQPEREPSPQAAPPRQRNLFGEAIPAAKVRTKRPDPEPEAISAHRATRRWKSLAEFVVGASNRIAHAAAVTAIDEPGQGANPLVFCGPVGVGKTHLLEGIFAGLKRRLDCRPCYTTAEEFTTRFVQSSRLGKMAAFRRYYRDCSALLLDNLNFLATKRATQEEFLHTFDSLVADGRQGRTDRIQQSDLTAIESELESAGGGAGLTP